MTVEEVVECLNKHIQKKRKQLGLLNTSFLVLQKLSKKNPVFKIYREYIYTLWLVNNTEKSRVLEVKYTDRVVDKNEEAVEKLIDMEFTKRIFDLINTDLHEDIIKGTYHFT